MKLNLYQKELLAIDGSKFRAVNAKRNSYNQDTLTKKLARIDDNIAKYLSSMDEEDQDQQSSTKYTEEEIKAAIEELKERKEKYTSYLNELQSTGETQKLTTDPDARVMHSKDGYHCYYNVQTSVDSGSHLIADYLVTNCCTDQGLLREVSENTRKALNLETIQIVADKGYESRKDILDCVMNGIIPIVAMKYDKEERIYNVPYIEAEISEEEKQSLNPEHIQKCISAGVLPSCYEKSLIEVSVLTKQFGISCFLLNEDGTVTCPMGNILQKIKTKGVNTIYANKDACRQCFNKCTISTKHKTVSFAPSTKYVPVRMYGNGEFKYQQIPDHLEPNRDNHTLDRKDHSGSKVVLQIKPNSKKIKDRMCLSEHPFGTVKWHHGAHYFLCKGKERVTAEMGLSLLAYNLKRAINLVGTKELIAAM
jgi:transposase